MSDILASVSVVLGAEISGFRAAMATARKELKGLVQFSEGLKDIGTSLTTYVSAPLALLGAASVAASAKMESLGKGLQAITQADLGKQGVTGLALLQESAQQASARMLELQELAKAPGIGFEQAVAGDIRLRAVGISAAQSAKSLKEFANAIATTGGGAGEFDRVTTQLAQLSAKGKVLSQDLRPIIEAAPAVSQALLKLYGTIDSETISASLTKQGKSSQDFIAVLTDELAKLPRVAGGLANSFENLQQTAVQSAAKLGDGISKALNLPAVLEGLSNGIERLGNAFAGLSPSTQKLVISLGVVAAATGPVLVAIGTLGAALPAITAGFATLGVSSLAALGPVGIAVAAVGVAAALIIDHWDDLTAYFAPTGEGGQVFSNLASSVSESVNSISQAFSQLNGGGNFGDLVSATGIFKAVFRDLAVGITAVSDVLGGSIGALSNLLQGNFSASLQEAQRAAFGLIDPLANLLGFTKKVQEGFEGAAGGGGAFGTSLLQASGILTGFNAQLQGFAGGLPQYGSAVGQVSGLLVRLHEQLKQLKEDQQNAGTEKAALAFNPLIKNLQEYIARLEGADKAGKKATDALANLRQELLNNANASRALGDLYDYSGGRAKVLESGIKSLTDAGFAPGGKVVQAYVAQLRAVPQAMDQLAQRMVKGTEKLFETPDLELPKADLSIPEFKLKPIDTAPFTASINEATKQLARFQKVAEDFNDGLGQILTQGMNNIAVGFGEAIGNILTGASGLEGLGAAILAPIGDMISQLGQLAIAAGIGIQAIQTSLQTLNPVVAIGAGIALVAIGSAVKGAASNLAKGGAGGARAASGAISSPQVGNYGQRSNQTTIKVLAEFRLRGQDLTAIGRQQTFRSKVTD